METCKHEATEMWRHNYMEIWKHGDMETLRYEGKETWRHGGMETWRHRDTETWRLRDMETWRHGDMETWRPGDSETWRHGDMETWIHGDIGYIWTWRHGHGHEKTCVVITQIELTCTTLENHGNSEFRSWYSAEYLGIHRNFVKLLLRKSKPIPAKVRKYRSNKFRRNSVDTLLLYCWDSASL